MPPAETDAWIADVTLERTRGASRGVGKRVSFDRFQFSFIRINGKQRTGSCPEISVAGLSRERRIDRSNLSREVRRDVGGGNFFIFAS